MIGPKKLTKKQFCFLHFLVVLSLFAFWGYLETANKYLILFSVLSFFGALCEVFKYLVRK
jgi:hypothetical protein